MKQVRKEIEYNGKKYPIAFNLNVMEEIQQEYGTLEKWGDLTDVKTGEIDFKAYLFGMMCMINEGIEIMNDENGTHEQLLTKKQVGRIITEYGVEKMAEKTNNMIIESSKIDAPKNESSTKKKKGTL